MNDIFKPLHEFPIKEFEWIWDKRIPRGELTMLEGDPGTGKSTILSLIAARMTSLEAQTNNQLPEYLPKKPLNILFIDTEQDISTTLRPRLEHFSVDVNHIECADLDFGENYLDVIEELVQRLEYKYYDLVIIDALFDVTDADPNKQRDVNKFLSKIRSLARKHNVAIIGVRHWNKAGHTTALYKGSGSVKITGIARSVITVSKHPDDPDKRLLAWAKLNNGLLPETLVFSIQGEALPEVIWHGTSELTADQLLDPRPTTSSRLNEAKEFLRELVTSEGIEATTAIRAAEEGGIAVRTLNRAKKEVGVITRSKDKKWFWYLETEKQTALYN